jgi:hypothetical protein
MQLQVTNIHRRSTNQILRRLGRSVRPLIDTIAILVGYALLPRTPLPQGAGSMLARTKVSPLADSLRTPKPNHRSQ